MNFSDVCIGKFSQESTKVAFLYYQLWLPSEFQICAPQSIKMLKLLGKQQ